MNAVLWLSEHQQDYRQGSAHVHDAAGSSGCNMVAFSRLRLWKCTALLLHGGQGAQQEEVMLAYVNR